MVPAHSGVTSVHPKAGKFWSIWEVVIQMRLDIDTGQTAIIRDKRCIQALAVTSHAQN